MNNITFHLLRCASTSSCDQVLLPLCVGDSVAGDKVELLIPGYTILF